MIVVPKKVHVALEPEQLLQQEAHLEHGGMLVPFGGDAPAPMTDIELSLESAGGKAQVHARVVHVGGDGTVGLAFDDIPAARKRLDPLFQRARAGGGGADNLRLRITRMNSLEKQELALTGDRPARMAILKDSNKALHSLLLKNRKITSEEIRMIAAFRNANPDALGKIALNKDWVRDPRIVTALVSNPKTPPQVAIRLLDKVARTELRRLAKGVDVPPAIARAARRKLG